MTESPSKGREGLRQQGRPTVVVVSADSSLRRQVWESLRGAYRVRRSRTVPEALERIEANGIALVIADHCLPGEGCAELVDRVRLMGHVPIMVAVDPGEACLSWVNLDADDFVFKPPAGRELQIKAALCLREVPGIEVITIEGLSVDTAMRTVQVDGVIEQLTRREFDLLVHLATHPGVTFSREQILKEVWRSSSQWQDPGTVTEHVHRLRHKLERDPDRPRWIVTLRGEGYRFQPQRAATLPVALK